MAKKPVQDKKVLVALTPKPTMYQEYRDSFGNQQLLTALFLEKLGNGLVDYARNSDGSDHIIDYLDQCGVPYKTFQNWCNKYPLLREDFDQAKYLIGAKLVKGVLKKNLETRLGMLLIHHHLPEHIETHIKLAEHESDDKNGRDRYIIMSPITTEEPNGNK